jgi:hypothetical protein
MNHYAAYSFPHRDTGNDVERIVDSVHHTSRLRGPDAPTFVPPTQRSRFPQRDVGDYTCAEDLYLAMSMFKKDTYVPAVGDQRHLTAVDSILSGRADKDTTVRSSSYSLFPAAANTLRGTDHAARMVTTSSRLEFGELPNTRVFLNTTNPTSMLNLTPTSARNDCREKDVARLNRINDAYVAARIQAAL